jgi:hypothetical protein
MTDFNKLVNDSHNAWVNEQVAYHMARAAAWGKNKELFGKALPECDGWIAYHLDMVEIKRALVA